MNLSKKTTEQISRYYDDLKNGVKALGPELSESFQKDVLYERITLKIADHERQRRSFRRIVGVASVILVIAGLSFAFYQQLYRKTSKEIPVVMQTAVAARGRVLQLSLGDGTEIWLNSGSKLTYPKAFSGKTRGVTLEGEAYFQVAHDASRPFSIRTGKLITKVLGTSFNIKAYPEDRNIRVAVLTGKVRVSMPTAKGMDSVALTPHELVTFNKAKQTIRVGDVANTAHLISWREGRLHYDGVPLRVVIADLQRKYDVEIHATAALGSRGITADFRDESIKKVMIVLSEMTGSKLVKTENGYLLH